MKPTIGDQLRKVQREIDEELDARRSVQATKEAADEVYKRRSAKDWQQLPTRRCQCTQTFSIEWEGQTLCRDCHAVAQETHTIELKVTANQLKVIEGLVRQVLPMAWNNDAYWSELNDLMRVLKEAKR